MRVRHKYVEVRIAKRTLWVEDQAYPLSQIAAVRPREFRPRRARMVMAYLRRAGGSLGLGMAGLVVLGCLHGLIPGYATTVLAVAVTGLLGFNTFQLVQLLRRPTLYALSIATAGSTTAVVVTTDAQRIKDLAKHVVDAIENPAIDYAVHIDVIHGDKVYGNKIEGDEILGDYVARDKVSA